MGTKQPAFRFPFYRRLEAACHGFRSEKTDARSGKWVSDLTGLLLQYTNVLHGCPINHFF